MHVLVYFSFVVVVFIPEALNYHMGMESHADKDIVLLRNKLKHSKEYMEQMEVNTVQSVKRIIYEKQLEQKNKIQQCQTTLKNLKNNHHSYHHVSSNLIQKDCVNQEIYETRKMFLRGNLQKCYPTVDAVNQLKQTQKRFQKLDLAVGNILKYCEQSSHYHQPAFCIRRKVNTVYHQIFALQQEYVDQLRKIILYCEKCSTKLNYSIDRSLKHILEKTKSCLGTGY